MSAVLSAATSATGRGQQAEDSLRTSPGVQVRIDGRISLKHIGDVDAVGLTLTQLADYLKELYSSVFSDPNIAVVLVQSNSQRYTVMGKVAKPGVYYLDYPINIVQTVARCGGFTEWAKSKVTLVRKEPKRDRKLFKGNTLLFDYGDFLDGADLEKNLFIEPGDIYCQLIDHVEGDAKEEICVPRCDSAVLSRCWHSWRRLRSFCQGLQSGWRHQRWL